MSFLSLFAFLFICSYNGVACKKSFKTKYGDIFDCIDFYKQPSFKHPMLKNHSFHPLMRPNFLVKKSKERNTPTSKLNIKGETCPIGFVPMRRLTECVSNTSIVHEISGTYKAGVRTKLGSSKYGGGGMHFSVWNPRFVQPSAYTQARLQVSSGPDAIQVGWRVDPSLRGDNRTRVYIYTDAGQSHCFDAQCGFVQCSRDFLFGDVFEPSSQPGNTTYESNFNITRDKSTGNWWLFNGPNLTEIGFWPKDIFTALGADFASEVEWAGEVYSPPGYGVEEPLMGSGYKPEVEKSQYVAYFAQMTVVTENYTSIDADDLEEFANDRPLYDVKNKGDIKDYHRFAYYGGARY